VQKSSTRVAANRLPKRKKAPSLIARRAYRKHRLIPRPFSRDARSLDFCTSSFYAAAAR
jgi:hypothetical protein